MRKVKLTTEENRIKMQEFRKKHPTTQISLVKQMKKLHLKCSYPKCKMNGISFINTKTYCKKHFKLIKYQMKNKEVRTWLINRKPQH